MVAADLVTATLQDLGILQPTEAPSAEDMAVSLRRLNRLIDGWKVQRLMIASIVRTTWTLVSGTASYTVGTGGAVNVGRPTIPNEIVVNFIDTSLDEPTEMPLGLLTDAAYQAIPQKAITALYPSYVYYNPTYGNSDTGLGTLTFWQVPTSSDLQGVIYIPTPLDELALSTTNFYAPPGYRRLYETSLAVELAGAFTRPVTPEMRQLASDALADVKRINIRLVDMSIDPALTRPNSPRSNIYTGNV